MLGQAAQTACKSRVLQVLSQLVAYWGTGEADEGVTHWVSKSWVNDPFTGGW